MSESSKNKYQHNDDGTTFIFIESKSKYFPGKHTVIIDTEDWDKVKEYRWSITSGSRAKYPYAHTSIPHPDGGWRKCGIRSRRTALKLHHVIVGKRPKGKFVDHANHNGLDNRKENLRFANYGQNGANRRTPKNSTSQYLGVAWNKQSQKWRAQLTHNKKVYHLGSFTCEHQAALAYNKKAIELHGEYANLNVVPQEYVLKYNK